MSALQSSRQISGADDPSLHSWKLLHVAMRTASLQVPDAEESSWSKVFNVELTTEFTTPGSRESEIIFPAKTSEQRPMEDAGTQDWESCSDRVTLCGWLPDMYQVDADSAL